MNLTTKQQVAEVYFAMTTMKKWLEQEGIPELTPGEYDLSGRELTIKFHPGAKVVRDAGKNGDGTEDKKASQQLYGYAIIAALLHYASKPDAPRLSVNLVTEIVEYALECNISSESAFQTIHPRMAKAIATVKDKIREKLGFITYPTRRLIQGSMALISRKAQKKKAA